MLIKELVASLGLDVDLSGFAKAAGALGMLKAGMDVVADAIKQVGHALFHMIGETAAGAVEIERSAQKIGVSTDALQELRFAAKAAGVDAEALQIGMTRLSRSAFEATTKGGESARMYQRLGVHLKGANGQMRPSEELLGDISEKFASMPDGVKKTALAVEIFGRSGANLIPFLNKGRDGVAELREEAHRFGLVLDKDTIARSKDYIKVNRELGEALEGVKLAIVGPLIYGAAWKKTLTEVLITTRQWIALQMPKALHALHVALRAVVAVFTFLANLFKFFTGTIIGQLLLSLGAVALAYWAVASGAVAAAAAAIAAWVMAALPFIALAAAIGLVALLIEDLYVALVQGGDTFLTRHAPRLIAFLRTLKGGFESVRAVWDGITDALSTAIDFWKKEIGGFVDYVRGLPFVGGKAGAQFGGGASPAASVAASPSVVGGGSVVVSPTLQTTINAAPGQSPAQIADAVTQHFQDMLDTHLRQAAAAVSP